LLIFLRFQAATHISRMNCPEITGDRSTQPTYEIFSIKKIDFNGVSFDLLGSRSPPYEGIKFGYRRQNGRFLLLWTNLA